MIVILIVYVPKNKIREAQLIFFFKQLITWFFGLIVVQLRLIEYPFRLFPYANKTSFSFEYFIYPAICVIFNLHYPKNVGKLKQFLYYVYFCTAITVFEELCVEYTNLIKYIHWTWYYTWVSFYLTFYISHKYYLWFFKESKT
ncbi:MAG TPA: CBO0543 family protein [Ruminiclostridium sp.]|nr:CBO0543 family protein [Ruminiclostridium sp.]